MTHERELLRETVATLVAKHASPAAVREAMESTRGYDESLWRLLCEQVGAAALVVPEEYGGAGGNLGDAAIVLEELGKRLVPSPLLGTMLAELALLASDGPDAHTLRSLAALAEGTMIGAVVFDPDYVVNGDTADIVIAAGTQDSPGMLTRWTTFNTEPVATMDPTRRLARVTPHNIAPIGVDPGIADIAAVLLAAEQIGAAAQCLELTVEYTKHRVQFGRPIGSFQAVKHRLADLYVAVQAARAVVYDAVEEAERTKQKPSATSAALARVAATEAFNAVAAEGIQLHGGIAITWEHDMQLYFKRAHGSSQLLGPARAQLHRLESEVFSLPTMQRGQATPPAYAQRTDIEARSPKPTPPPARGSELGNLL
jgi:alkylation response protein AidB-like acyl-CoA dehydrogenase